MERLKLPHDDFVKLITVGCTKHLQKRNRLKGIAMQKIILNTLENKKEDISIKKILEIISKKLPEYYIVDSPFQVNGKDFKFKWEYVHFSEFPKIMNVKIKHKIVDKKWKKCSICSQFILAEKQKTKKCRSCNLGFFRYLTKEYEVLVDLINGQRKDVLDYLIEFGYLKQVKKINKRVDFFRFADGVFYIFESKNKEVSGLSFNDLRRTLMYPIIIKNCGYIVKEIRLIFNGFINLDLKLAIEEGYGVKYGFHVEFQTIDNYLKLCNLKVKELIIEWKDGKYSYKIIEGDKEYDRIYIRILSFKEEKVE